MTHSIYDYSVPVYAAMLTNLSKILTFAEANAAERRIAPEVLLNARLAPDMFHLIRQVQITTDHAKGAASRLAGKPVPSWPDEEKTFQDLQDRIAKTKTLLKNADRKDFEGAEDRVIEMKAGPRELKFSGFDYLNRFSMPNFQFHMAMTYAILRHNGVPVGKANYMGG